MPVVLVHGGGATDLRIWSAQVEPFAQHYRVIAYSRRYHWPNALADDGWDVSSTPLQAADLDGLIRTLDLAPFPVVGVSSGGDIDVLLADEHPDLVLSLMLGEPALLSLLPRLPGGEALYAENLSSIEPTAPAVQRGDVEAAERLFIDAALGAEVYDQLPAPVRERIRDNARNLGFERPDRDDTTFGCAEAGMIAAPAPLLTGDDSLAMFRLVAEGLTQCLPGIERTLIPHTDHLLHVMNPAAYNAAVLAFLAEH